MDDFQYGLDYDLKNNSAGSRVNAADVNRSLRNLQDKVSEFREKFANPYVAASRGFVDEIVEPSDTRERIAFALEAAR